MATFNPITITTAGQEILAQAIAGQGTLTFSKVSSSSTVMSGDLKDVTALTNIKQTVTPSSAILNDNTIQVSSIFSNSGVASEYPLNTLGLYAKIENDEVLFAIATALEADVMPTQNASPSNFYYQFNISISDASQITVSVPENGYLSAAIFYNIFPGISVPSEENTGQTIAYEDGKWAYTDIPDISGLQQTVQQQGDVISGLQQTVQQQGKDIADNSEKLAGIGLIKYIEDMDEQAGQYIAISGVSLPPNALYVVNINVEIKGETGKKEFTPTLTAALTSSLRVNVTTGTKIYIEDASGNNTYINETFFINSVLPYSDLQFSLDDNEHTFGQCKITIFRLN